MNVILWFLGGLVLVAAISLGAAYLFRAKSRNEKPLHPDNLPKDWESVMPKERRNLNRPVSKSSEPSFRKIGVKSNSNTRGFKKLW